MDSLTFLMYQLLVLFIIPAVLMLIFYTVVIRELWKSTKNIHMLTNSAKRKGSSKSSSEGKSYMRTTSMEVATIGSCRSYSIRSARVAEEHPSTYNPSTYTPSSSGYISYNGRESIRSKASIRLGIKKHIDRGEDVKKARKQVIKMLIVVLALFLLCWGPYIVVEILINIGMQSFSQWFYVMKTLLALLPYVHCCINPIIYVFMCKKFRRAMKRYCIRKIFEHYH
ncbi:unnamed protein product [Meganyctiphanes norvegica]|uniref:G-protein coupled receptors family 1 profile domain-containing protein n=1 Tax=Meganyctiphanes norvegica TaxID=48144 RepID=A0AAV2QUA4_MEGNR